jgi:putative transposase
MGRPLRAAEGGLTYHALNRANGRATLFDGAPDYEAFVRVLADAVDRFPVRLFAYCVMPNHFHLVLRPDDDGGLSQFMRWLTLTHTQRWHAHRHSAGTGHVYHGRFKSFPVQDDGHFYTVCRYVERNALRAGLATRAEDWPWGSLRPGPASTAASPLPTLSRWPVRRPSDWLKRVNAPMSPAEEEAMARCLRRSQPLGTLGWTEATVRRLGLESTTRPLGRPRKEENNGS